MVQIRYVISIQVIFNSHILYDMLITNLLGVFKVITEIINEYEKKKEEAVSALQEELKEKLKSASSEEEKEQLVMNYANKMAVVQEEIEVEKQRELKTARQRLREERQRRKKELWRFVN